jgi:hypothetical protein
VPASHSRRAREASWPFSMLPGSSTSLPAGEPFHGEYKVANRRLGPVGQLVTDLKIKKSCTFRHSSEVARGAMGDAPEELPWGLDAKKLQKVGWQAGRLCSASPPPARASSVPSAMLRGRISAASGVGARWPARRGLRLTGGCFWLIAGLQGTTDERQDQGVPDRHTGRWLLCERAQTGVGQSGCSPLGAHCAHAHDDARLCLMPLQTKSKFQRHKEEQEAKKRAEEEEAVSAWLLTHSHARAPPCLFLAAAAHVPGGRFKSVDPPLSVQPLSGLYNIRHHLTSAMTTSQNPLSRFLCASLPILYARLE